MFKWIVRDYFAAFRWENIKEILKNGGLFVAIYLCGFIPVTGGFTEKKEYLLTYVLIAVPLAFISLSGKLHSIKLPKVMFLCPIDRNVRREYIVKSCCFRIGLHVAINALAILILVCMGLCDWVSSIVLELNSAFLTLFMLGVKKRKNSVYRDPFPSTEITKESIVGILNVFFVIISSSGVACMLCWDTPVAWWVKYIFLSIALVVQLPLTIAYMTYWKKAVEEAVDYESSYL